MSFPRAESHLCAACLLAIVLAQVGVHSTPLRAQVPVLEFHPVGPQGRLNGVLDILQDERGYIWVAGIRGLARYDGRELRGYELQGGPEPGLHSRRMDVLAEDAGGTLWAGGIAGFARYERGRDTWVREDLGIEWAREINRNRVRDLVPDRFGNLWLLTYQGLLGYRRGRGVFFRIHGRAELPGARIPAPIRQISAGPGDSLFLALDGPRLMRLETSSGAIEEVVVPAPRDSVRFDGPVHILYAEPGRRLWLGGGRQLLRCDLGRGTSVPFAVLGSGARPVHVRSMLRDADGRLWVGTTGQGLFIYPSDGALARAYRPGEQRFSLPGETVGSLLQDRGGVIWVGTSRGLCRCDGRAGRFEFLRLGSADRRENSERMIRTICRDSRGIVWLGTARRGLRRLDRARQELAEDADLQGARGGSRARTVTALVEDRQGALWIGYRDRGLARFEPGKGIIRSLRHNPADASTLSSDEIRALRIGPQGSLWIGTAAGLDRLDPQRGTLTHMSLPAVPGGAPSGVMQSGIQPAAQGLWVLVSGGGIFHLDPVRGSMRRLEQRGEDAFEPRRIRTLAESGGLLWLGSNNGLFSLDPTSGVLRCVPGSEPYSIMAVLVDRAGRLWAGTSRCGLISYDPARGKLSQHRICSLVDQAGYFPGACFLAADGEMLFGAYPGLVCFHPDRIVPNPVPPPVVLEGIQILGRPLALEHHSGCTPIRLRHSDGFVTIEYRGLDFLDPGRNSFAYRLLGLEEQWTHCGSRTYASYSNLDSREYTFQVMAANSEGTWGDAVDLVRLHVDPAPWATWWFRGAAFALLAGLAWLLYRWRVNEVRRYSLHLEAEVSKRTAELDDAHEALLRSERLAAIGQVTAMVSHELRNPLGTIATSTSAIRARVEDSAVDLEPPLARIERSLGRCVRTIDQLLDFGRVPRPHWEETEIDSWLARILAEEDLPADLSITSKLRAGARLAIDRDWTRRCFQNLLENAYHAAGEVRAKGESAEVQVATRLGDGRLEILVRDRGPGIPAEIRSKIFEPLFSTKSFGSGLGLAIVRQAMERMGGGVEIASAPGGGTLAVLWFPLPRSAPAGEHQR